MLLVRGGGAGGAGASSVCGRPITTHELALSCNSRQSGSKWAARICECEWFGGNNGSPCAMRVGSELVVEIALVVPTLL